MDDISKESALQDIYDTFDLVVDQDLLGGWFAHDPNVEFSSPTFQSMEELEDWLIDNRVTLVRELG